MRIVIIRIQNNSLVINSFNNNTDLLVNINSLQIDMSKATYFTSLTTNQLAYTQTNMTLPYSQYTSQVNLTSQLAELQTTINNLQQIVQKTSSMMIQRVDNGKLSQSDITLQVHYQTLPGTKQFYTKSLTIIQSSFQLITYIQ